MGEVFAGRYELVDVVADGGMGTVWRVWDLREQVYRAAKMLKQSDSATLLRFVRETSTRIEHDHVVAPTGWSAEDDRVLFAMPLVDGGSVATLLADYGPLPPGWVRELTLQLLEALDAVHAAGIVHRDVKPANLLLQATGTARPHLLLSDFGIATARDEPRLTRATEVVHTPGYAAPEMSSGADPDPRQDLYAVGVVMQEMITGRRPEPGATPSSVDGPFASVQTRLVASDPLERFASAAEARAALDAFDAGPEDGEAIEVFDHLQPLPPGWGPHGSGSDPDPPRDEPPHEPPPASMPVAARMSMSGRTLQLVAAAGLAVIGVVLLLAAVLML